MVNDQKKFRTDVELLRGIAVLVVVLFHLKIKFFSSGFIGVDIFFVISGYLMANALCGDAPEKILDFYERRARRVLPAAIVVMAIFLLISPFLFLPFEISKVQSSYLGALFFIPNVIFWRDDEYFSDLNFSPLLHYWSLGVELQYYILFPILVHWFKRNNWIYISIGIASFCLSIFITNYSSKTAFFLLPTRMWEFFAGYCAFMLFSKNQFSTLKGGSVYSLIALIFLVVGSALAIPQNKYPGVYALLPACLSFVFLAIGVQDNILKRIPGVGLLRLAGKFSYSIYLIHFPVIFCFLYVPFSKNIELSIGQQCVIVLITLVLSAISYRYVEAPLRSKRNFNTQNFLKILLSLYLGALVILCVFNFFNYFEGIYSKKDQLIFRALSDMGQSRCSKLQKFKEYGESSCYLINFDRPTKNVYLVGDSQIDALKEIFVEEAAPTRINIRLNRDRCFLGQGQCSSSEIIKQVQKYQITDVVLHGWDNSRFNYPDLYSLAKWASEHEVKIHFIGPVPTYADSVPKFLYQELHSSSTNNIRLSYEQYREGIYFEYKDFEANNLNMKNVYFYDTGRYFCPEPSCLLENDSGIFYFDAHHPTITGARILVPMIKLIYGK